MPQYFLSVKNLLAFSAGIVLAIFPSGLHLSDLSPFLLQHLPWISGFSAIICLMLYLKHAHHVLLYSLCLSGFFWGLQQAYETASSLLNAELDDQQFIVEGVISGLPRKIESFGRKGQQFDVKLDRSSCIRSSPLCESLQLQLLRLRWMEGPNVSAGETWNFIVELRRPRGLANPAGRDYEIWLVQQGISATGKIIEGHRITEAIGFLSWRESITRKLQNNLKNYSNRGILEALINGNNAAIDPLFWDLFSATNTTHLFVISGLHLSLMGGLCWWLFRRVFIVFFPGHSFYSSLLAAFIAWVCAASYALMAGWAIPVQRALALFTMIMLVFLLRRSLQPLQSLILLFTICLFIDPLCLLSMSFWLSWSAASVLLLGLTGRRQQSTRLLWFCRQWARSQWIITLGLAPVLIASIGQLSLLGFFANLIAIPLVNLIVVPFDLIALLSSFFSLSISSGIWLVLDNLLTVLLQFLQILIDQASFLIWQPVTAFLPLALLSIGAFVFLLPKALPARSVALLCVLPILFSFSPQIPEDELHMTVFDVGQGLAVLIQVDNKTLLYDTGPRLGETTDAAKAVILPFLYQQGIRHIDHLVISHGDMDHVGGLKSLYEDIPVHEILGGEVLPDISSKFCESAMNWQWHKFSFEFLHSHFLDGFSDVKSNNKSCVLRISRSDYPDNPALVLLPGDIEKKIEYELLRQNRSALQSEVVLMPHHGSRTSSSPAFVKAVSPRLAISSSGYRHRFGHPHAEIVQRYKDNNALALNTADTGAISMVWRQGSWQIVDLYRQQRSYFWQ